MTSKKCSGNAETHPVNRQVCVNGTLDTRLSKYQNTLGSVYTIMEMDMWGWTRIVPYALGDDALANSRFVVAVRATM